MQRPGAAVLRLLEAQPTSSIALPRRAPLRVAAARRQPCNGSQPRSSSSSPTSASQAAGAPAPLYISVKRLLTDGAKLDLEVQAAEELQAAFRQVPGVRDVEVNPDGCCLLRAEEGVAIEPLLDAVRRLERGYRPLPYAEHTWEWRGHTCLYGEAGPPDAPAVVCVHGFGASGGHFRKIVQELQRGYHVFTLDLLGFGGSAKPAGVAYDPYLWQQQTADFLQQVVGRPAVLVGNSIGSQVAVYCAAERPELVRALVLLNVTGGMNFRGLYSEDWRLALAAPFVALVEAALLRLPAVSAWAFEKFSSRDQVYSVLAQQVYRNQLAIDEELLSLLLEPAADPGALGVFVQVFTGDPGPRPEKCMARVRCPTQVQWGSADKWTPPGGPLAKHFQGLAREAQGQVEYHELDDCGHCPQDDRPELVLEHLVPFLDRVTSEQQGAAAATAAGQRQQEAAVRPASEA